ncbi:MAG: hypothetical protein KAX39_05945 [candidate division Zixibacteria bacterium]|nr:hypothetical protein [candidate division Zixibacteria bacterium]
MTVSLIGELIGALLITYVLTRSIRKLGEKKLTKRNSAVVAFLVVLALVLVITPFTFGLFHGLALYLPCLTLWLIIDLFKATKRQPPKDSESGFPCS